MVHSWFGVSLLGLGLLVSGEVKADTGGASGEDTGAGESEDSGDFEDEDTGDGGSVAESDSGEPGIPSADVAGESGGHGCFESLAAIALAPAVAWRRRNTC
jgi:hypothetical protein